MSEYKLVLTSDEEIIKVAGIDIDRARLNGSLAVGWAQLEYSVVRSHPHIFRPGSVTITENEGDQVYDIDHNVASGTNKIEEFLNFMKQGAN